MNISILRTLATLCLGAALGPVCLMAQDPMKVAIPFDFTVGSKAFAAGKYTVRRDTAPGVVAIQSADHRSTMVVITNAVETLKTPGAAKLVFKQYGDRYFLSEVWPAGSTRGRQLMPSRPEKELIAKAATPQPVTLVASNK